jgi:nucleotide-binding universal stress UspA family protein
MEYRHAPTNSAPFKQYLPTFPYAHGTEELETYSYRSLRDEIDKPPLEVLMKTLEAGKRIALGNILFATDFSPQSDVALQYALAIARQYGAKIFGAHVVPSEDYLFSAPDLWPAHVREEDRLREEVTERLEKQLGKVKHEVLFGVGEASSVLSHLIGEHDIDLLVVGTHGRTGARKLLMGSIAEKLFRQAPCPVLTIGPNVSRKLAQEIRFHNILFATDFSKHSLAALPYAVSLAEEDQAQLSFLHVVDQSAAAIADLQAVKSSLMRRLEELAPPESESWCNLQCLVEFSQPFALPAEKIVEIASDCPADLIVLGLRPTHRALSTVTHLSHSIAQHVVAHAACPVLTVRE